MQTLTIITGCLLLVVLTSANSLSERDLDDAVVSTVERALDNLNKAFRSYRSPDHYLERRGWLGDTWERIKNAASKYWDENKDQIITTGVAAVLGKKRDLENLVLETRFAKREDKIDGNVVGIDEALDALKIVEAFLETVKAYEAQKS